MKLGSGGATVAVRDGRCPDRVWSEDEAAHRAASWTWPCWPPCLPVYGKMAIAFRSGEGPLWLDVRMTWPLHLNTRVL